MTWRGCFGVRIYGVDKLTYSGKNASIEGLGLVIIKETINLIEKLGYDNSIKLWKSQARNLILTDKPDCQYKQRTLQDILSKGTAYDANNLILNSKACDWAYIMNLDTEFFEIYEGNQKKYHNNGRFCRIRLAESFIPCALFIEVPMKELLNPYSFLLSEESFDRMNFV